MSRSSLSTAVALFVLALGVWLGPARAAAAESAAASAAQRRVVLLETPNALERALRTALMPWGMRVDRSRERARPRPPKSREQARTLARRLRADALVWLAPALRRHELWLYDGANGTLTTRSVPAPPFDETRAAALALSVKTELRKGTLAGATPVSDVAAKTVPPAGKDAALLDASEPPRGSAPTADGDGSRSLEPRASAEPRPRAEEREPEPEAPEALEEEAPTPARPEDEASIAAPQWIPSDTPRWKLVLHAAARQGATTLGGSEGRYAVEGRWAPWAGPASRAALWLSARVDMGLPRPVENAGFRGEYSELGGGLGAGVGLRLSRWFELGVQVGAALRTATISGALSDATTAAQTRRGLDLHLRPELELSLGALGLLVQPGLGAGITRQRYQADGVEVLETSGIWWQLGAGMRVALD